MNRQGVVLVAMVLPTMFSACTKREFNKTGSDTEAYGNSKIHLVIAAKPDSTQQRLWICNGTDVASGSSREGYPISIGVGFDGEGTDPNLPIEVRNQEGSNLTPVGRFEVSAMIGAGRQNGENCSSPGFEGMTTRCLGLEGLEPGINDSTSYRGIYLHGTPSGNYGRLGRSASHGCIRMHNRDIVTVYDYPGVRNATKVYISSLEARYQSGEHACTFAGNPG